MNYKEKLEEAKRLYETANADQRYVLESLFPEIQESEDERIRREIINYFECQSKEEPSRKDTHNKWIAWLEKDIIPNHNDIDSSFIEDIKNVINEAPLLMQSDKEKMIDWLEKQGEPQDKGEISDGYHTFNELYYYRMLYNAAFFNMLPKEWVHKSKRHNDGEECFGGGWFIVMANLPTGQISNHYELKDWDLFQIPEKEVADKWDGHTPQEAADRLHKYLLEKRGEQKPANTVEPKFKVGDWVVYYRNDSSREVLQVYDIRDGRYYFNDNVHFSWSVKECDEKSHLWTLADAKDGDILATPNYIYIFNSIDKETELVAFYCLMKKSDEHFSFGDYRIFDEILNSVPATNEQRDTLMKAMTNAGYTFDFEKKELKLLITNGGDFFESENCEQKHTDKVEPKFREGDSIQFKGFGHNRYTIKEVCGLSHYINTMGNRMDMSYTDANFEVIKDSDKVEISTAWSEKDERTIHNIDAAIRHEVVFPINELKSMEIWLESLKYRIRPKHEWKRDEKMFQLIEDVIDVYRKTQGSVVGGIYTEELKDFLNCIASKQKWTEEDEAGFGDALWAIKQAKTIAKDENDMGNLWYAERWLKNLVEKIKG